MTAELSPAAQAVLDAAFPVYDEEEHLYVVTGEKHAGMIAAAALRAAADQVVPEDPQEAMHFTTEAIRLNKRGIRRQFLAIAAELDGTQPTSGKA